MEYDPGGWWLRAGESPGPARNDVTAGGTATGTVRGMLAMGDAVALCLEEPSMSGAGCPQLRSGWFWDERRREITSRSPEAGGRAASMVQKHER